MVNNIDPTLPKGTTGVTNTGNLSGTQTQTGGSSQYRVTGTNENSLVDVDFNSSIEGATDEEMDSIKKAKKNIELQEARVQEQIDLIKKKEDELEQLKKELSSLNSQYAGETDQNKKASLKSKIDDKNLEISGKISEITTETNLLKNLIKLKDAATEDYQTLISEVRTSAQQRLEQQRLSAMSDDYSSDTGDFSGPINYPQGNVTKLTTKEEFKAYGFDTDEKIRRFKMMDPKMQQEVIGLIDFAKANGLKISFGSPQSIVRTREEQQAIWNRNLDKNGNPTGFAARPGSSQHESGRAIDIRIEGANMSNKNDPRCKLLGQYWLSRGYTWGGTWTKANEPWHFDLRPR